MTQRGAPGAPPSAPWTSCQTGSSALRRLVRAGRCRADDALHPLDARARAAQRLGRRARPASPLHRRRLRPAPRPARRSCPSSSCDLARDRLDVVGVAACACSPRKPASSSRSQSVLMRRGMPPVSAVDRSEARRRRSCGSSFQPTCLQPVLDVGLRLRRRPADRGGRRRSRAGAAAASAGSASSSRNSGWPTRKLCSSAWSPSWKLDSMRSSSTARGVRFCASSTISSARLLARSRAGRGTPRATRAASLLSTSLTGKAERRRRPRAACRRRRAAC